MAAHKTPYHLFLQINMQQTLTGTSAATCKLMELFNRVEIKEDNNQYSYPLFPTKYAHKIWKSTQLRARGPLIFLRTGECHLVWKCVS